MSRFIRAVLVALVSTASAVGAQTPGAIHFNFAAGASIPTSDFGTINSTGYNVMAGINMTPRSSPLGIRLEGIYNQFAKNDDFIDVGGPDQMAHVGGVTANATYNVLQPSASQSLSLYVIGGIGYYNTQDRFEDESFNDVGYNIGAGFKFPLTGFSVYLEARYHTVSSPNGTTFVPISFGVIF